MAGLRIGDRMIPFTLRNVDGRECSVTGLGGGNVSVVVFTCNHCPYALAWEDRLIEIAGEYAGQGVSVYAINANDPVKYPADNAEAMAARAREKAYPFPYLQDVTQEIARAYGAERTPEVFVFDVEGLLRYHGTVDDNAEEATRVRVGYVREALDAVLAGKKVAILQTTPVGCTIKWRPSAAPAGRG